MAKIRPLGAQLRSCVTLAVALIGASGCGERSASTQPSEPPDAGLSDTTGSTSPGPRETTPLDSWQKLARGAVHEADAALRRDGARLLLGPLDEGRAYDIGSNLSATFSDGLDLFPIDHPEQFLRLEPVGGAAETARLVGGQALYERAFTGVSAVVAAAHNGLHQALVLESPHAPDLFVWRAALGEGLRAQPLDNDETALVDQKGIVRLTVRAATLVDQKGRELRRPLRFGDDGHVRLTLDQRDVTFPALVRFSIEAPRRGLEAPLPEAIKGRVLVLLDTSGSMIFRFADDTTVHGDSPDSAVFCDNALGGSSTFACTQNVACTVANGGAPFWPVDSINTPSRMLAAKNALTTVITAQGGAIDFGLERFAAHSTCPNDTNCCTPQTNGSTRGRCQPIENYADIPSSSGDVDLTFGGSCGTDLNGGKVLVSPSPSSSTQVLRYVDFVEDFCSSTGSVGGAPRNPEIRGAGPTPLARAVSTARLQWYEPIYDVSSPGPGFDPNDPLFDPDINCRAYALVVMSDGADNCGRDPSSEVGRLTGVNGANPVKTYVLGVGQQSGPATAELNQMVAAGLTGTTAPVATSQQEIEAVFADIVSDTIKFEQCNNLDDNCNERIDEGLAVYQDCTAVDQCESGECDLGRCTCDIDSDCAANFTCAEDGFCRPACQVATKACKVNGVKKCGAEVGQCCRDNGSPTCDDVLTPPTIEEEICNDLDDDCDGLVDEGLPDCGDCVPFPEVCDGKDNDCDKLVDGADDDLTGVGGVCGLSAGACESGVVACIDGKLKCEGKKGPYTEVCNGLDDDCEGVTDGMSRACYTLGNTHPTRNVGACHDGSEGCTAPPGEPGVECSGAGCWSACIGDQTPVDEICDHRDNDCDGTIDEGIRVDPIDPDSAVTGDACCSFQDDSDDDLCGVGQCEFGLYACAGTRVVCAGGRGPSPEICDGVDNDCNGKIDDVAGQGKACVTGTECKGTFECDLTSGALICKPTENDDPELCNGLDDDCDSSVDEEPDVSDDDARLGKACDKPVPPQDHPPCQAGKTVCQNGLVGCDGAVHPEMEICNGIDDDCDGEVDDKAECPAQHQCFEGECVLLCGPGEFPCPGGLECVGRFCRPSDGGASGAGGDGGGAGGSDGGSSGGDNGGETGDSGSGAEGGSVDEVGPEPFFGLATGGGGCACRTGSGQPGGVGALLAGVLLAALRRRRPISAQYRRR